jgi:hypothetical protein
MPILSVRDEMELRGAMRPRLLTGPEGTRSAAPEAAPMAAYAQQIDAVAAVRRSAARLRIRRVLTDEI